MRILGFTKHFGAIGAHELAESLASAGTDGADLVVRDGQTVTPGDPGRLATVATALRDRDLELGVVTTDLIRPDDEADRVLAACGEAGVPLVRAGFFPFDPNAGYHACRDRARRDLAGLADLAAGHGVRLALQLHHGTVHPSGALALELARDRDDVLFYADPGNQAKEGSEDWRLTLDLLGERFACMGVKNAVWRRTSGHRWSCDWHPLADGGVVAWEDIAAGLRDRGFEGPLSLHVHYGPSDPIAALARDAAYVRSIAALS